MEIGFIGLGIMGCPMVANLIKGGGRVHVWSRRTESIQSVVTRGALACSSARQVAERCDVVFSMVADAPDVELVALGEQGVAQGARPGLIFVDMSTISPRAAKSIANQLKAHDVIMLDAPVSGGQKGAIEGTLTIMVGGDLAAFEKVLPVFRYMGKTVMHMGASGSGQVSKACNQILTGAGVAMVAEALNFARASGVDPVKVREVMLGGSAYSAVLENHGQRMLNRNFEPGFKAWMHGKDLKIVLDEAYRLGISVPATAMAAQLFNAVVGCGEEDKDSVSVLKVLERMSQSVESEVDHDA